MEQTDIDKRFDYHAPNTAKVREAHENVRFGCKNLANFLQKKLPEGREKALAITKLEEAMFWANAAIARNQSDYS